MAFALHAFRIVLMATATVVMFAVVAGGTLHLVRVLPFAALFGTLPALGICGSLHALELHLGERSALRIAICIGLLPSAVLAAICIILGVKGFFGDYSMQVQQAGWLWGVGWFDTSPLTVFARGATINS